MPKPKLSDFKKLIAEMTEAELRDELLKLFNKLEQVQMFYAQDLLSKDDRQKILQEAKDKIYKKFWTPSGSPRNNISNVDLRKIIADFEKISAFPHEVIDLILHRVEMANDLVNQFGGMPDADLNAASTAFDKALKLIKTHKLEEYFKERCLAMDEFEHQIYNYFEDWDEEE
jgi:Family of unknown function (DUF6155)